MAESEEPKGTGSALDFMPADTSLPLWRTRSTAARAVGCNAFATQAVFGEGPVSAELLLVGEQPGDKEDIAGEPFVGPGLTNYWIGRWSPPGINRSKVYGPTSSSIQVETLA